MKKKTAGEHLKARGRASAQNINKCMLCGLGAIDKTKCIIRPAAKGYYKTLVPSFICVQRSWPLLDLLLRFGIFGLPPFMTVLNIPSLSAADLARAFSLKLSV